MIHTEKDMKKWKNEQISYFRSYLKNFDDNSKEYRRLEKGIQDLENSVK